MENIAYFKNFEIKNFINIDEIENICKTIRVVNTEDGDVWAKNGFLLKCVKNNVEKCYFQYDGGDYTIAYTDMDDRLGCIKTTIIHNGKLLAIITENGNLELWYHDNGEVAAYINHEHNQFTKFEKGYREAHNISMY